MKSNRLSILLLLSISAVAQAISLENYQKVCSISNGTLQQKMLCKKFSKQIHKYPSAERNPRPSNDTEEVIVYQTKKPSKKQPVTKPTTKKPSIDSKARREGLKFKPYIPGAYKSPTEDKDES